MQNELHTSYDTGGREGGKSELHSEFCLKNKNKKKSKSTFHVFKMCYRTVVSVMNKQTVFASSKPRLHSYLQGVDYNSY